MTQPLLSLELPGIKKIKSGKVREIFDLGEAFLFVASDRISAFDFILPTGIPRKGEVLTQLSHFWFDRTERLVPNHRLARSGDALPPSLQPFAAQLHNQSVQFCTFVVRVQIKNSWVINNPNIGNPFVQVF